MASISSAQSVKLEHEHSAHKYVRLLVSQSESCADSTPSYHPLPVVFDKAKGALYVLFNSLVVYQALILTFLCSVWDPEGKEYIDMLSAYSCVFIGSQAITSLNICLQGCESRTLSSSTH